MALADGMEGAADDSGGCAPGSVTLRLVSGMALLRPDEQIFDAMLEGWRNQQMARNLDFCTIERRGNVMRVHGRGQRVPHAVVVADVRRVDRRWADGVAHPHVDGALLPGRGALVLPVRHRSGVRLADAV